ncbi:MAG: alanine racemase [Candidatus Paceibacterota bacterium]|jgi:alanine racemase|nr:alanine racemase [Candidatus Paceibacterota bacterium]
MEKPKIKLRTWIEIDKRAAEENYQAFRKLIKPETKLMAIVKSNAYGNELVGFSKMQDEFGADAFGVDSITEGLALREAGITKPILVLGYTIHENVRVASEKNISITLSNFEALDLLVKDKMPINVHIKIDSGMHRQGFFPKDVQKLADILLANKHITVEGMYTHFANAKNPSFSADTDSQAAEFKIAVDIFEKAGFKFLRHASATSGAMLFPEYHFDMVRIGIGLSGLWPAKEVERALEKNITLSPILSWKTVVAETKVLPKGDRIGYNFTETFRKDTKIAICPIGYWHGFPRVLSSIGHVLVKGKRARVLGRVSMDMIAIDVSDIENVKVSDEAILIGKSGNDAITAEEFASLADTSSYEVITRINPKIQRVFV